MATETSNMGNNNFRRSLASILVVLAVACSLASALGISRSTRAQESAPAIRPTLQAVNKIELHQALLDMTNPWTVMCIAAHPDDEDGTSLTVMRRKYGANTVSLFSTFGEGGQNAIGPELYEQLGAIRARETMAAAAIQGSEPYFLGLKDFGYSKSADEAFRVWGHEEALRRMVLQIRKLRPDVIITNHSATNNDHGHHQATARLEVEAFDAAPDPKRFAEQLKDGVVAWQVQRLFVRAGRGQPAAAVGQNPDRQGVPDSIVTIDPNELDPVRGKLYAEEALQALQQHATQGPWPKTVAQMAARFTNSSDGRLPLIRYRLTREAKSAETISKDSHNFLDGMALPGDAAKRLAPPTIEGKPLTGFIDQPGKVLNALVTASRQHVFGKEIIGSAKEILAEHRRARMLVRLNKSLAIASGVSIQLKTGNDVLVPGETTSLELAITNTGENPIRVTLIASGAGADERGHVLLSAKDRLNSAVPPGATVKLPTTFKLPEKAGFTVPHAAHLYETEFAGKPVVAAVFVELQGVKFPMIVQKLYDVTPTVEIESITPSPYVFTPANVNRPLAFKLVLNNHLAKPFKGEFGIGSATEHINEVGAEIVLGAKEKREFALLTNVIPVDTPDEKRTPRPDFGAIAFSVHPSGSATVITETEAKVVYADARVAPNLRVGYVRGFDWSLPTALAALGVEAKELTVDEVRTGDLQKYSTILVDNRAYELVPELIAANQRLLDYAKDGGTLVVFYHKSNEWNPDARRNRPQLAPYPLTLGDLRITDENAPLTISEAEDPLLNFPNKIGPEDFKGWIQERGLYYPKEWDPHYHALVSTNDPGEAPLTGGLLVADYGRGHYIYTSMVWYRQLRAGVPGGYRMFANMISYGRQGR